MLVKRPSPLLSQSAMSNVLCWCIQSGMLNKILSLESSNTNVNVSLSLQLRTTLKPKMANEECVSGM